MATMKAIRIHHFGGLEALELEDVPVPEPGENEVRLKMTAASLNPVDYKILHGRYPPIPAERLPLTSGRDVCGVVDACGPAPSPPAAGDELYAFIGEDRGSHAEYVIVKAGEYAAKPRQVDAAMAGAVPLAVLTAWQGLFVHGGLRPGQRVLIHGGAGGVGHFAIQLAKSVEAQVFTTVSAEDLDFVTGLGADQAIDYRSQRFEELVGDLDLVFDLVAGPTQDRSWQVLKEGGALISTLSEPSPQQAAARNIRSARYTARPDAGQLAEIARLIDAGKLRPVIDRCFALTDVRSACHHLEHDHLRGKVVLQPAPC
jgi:NADPH:quinone reductase-like Zn-dependent oxidoreductase